MWYVFVMFASVYETYVCVVGSLCTGQTETVNIYFLWLQFSAVSEGPFIFARFSSSSFAARTWRDFLRLHVCFVLEAAGVVFLLFGLNIQLRPPTLSEKAEISSLNLQIQISS